MLAASRFEQLSFELIWPNVRACKRPFVLQADDDEDDIMGAR